MVQALKPHNINGLPKFAQAQNSLEEQLLLAVQVLNHVGLYDAADFVKRRR